MYDIHEKCEYPPLCYNLDNVCMIGKSCGWEALRLSPPYIFQITNFLNKPEVMEDLGVNRTWEACRKLDELLVSCRQGQTCSLSMYACPSTVH